MSYVDAGYAIALATLFVYAITLVLRRRRWERALQVSQPPAAAAAAAEPEGVPARGEPS
jgi:hypothetical protein